MDEKIIARGTLKDSKAFCMALPILGLIGTILYDFPSATAIFPMGLAPAMVQTLLFTR